MFDHKAGMNGESRRSFPTGSLAKEEASDCVSRRRSLPYAFRAGSCRFSCIHAFCICSCRLADKDRRRGTRIAFSITCSTPLARVSHPRSFIPTLRVLETDDLYAIESLHHPSLILLPLRNMLICLITFAPFLSAIILSATTCNFLV